MSSKSYHHNGASDSHRREVVDISGNDGAEVPTAETGNSTTDPPDLEVPPFPLETLPERALRLVEAGANSMSCPPDLIAIPALVTFGAAIGMKRRLQVKPGWEEYASLYAASIYDAGGGKSPAQTLATAPIHMRQKTLWEQYRAALAKYTANNPGKGPTKSEQHQVQQDAKTKMLELPTLRQIVSTDATVEALALLLKENPTGIVSEQDELTSLIGGFNRYRKGVGADRQFYQSAWSCKPLIIHRVKVVGGHRKLDTLHVPLPFLCIIGGIQPDMLSTLSDEQGREDGFIHRFLFAYPNAMPHEESDEGVSMEDRRGYRELVDQLIALPENLVDVPMCFSDEAAECWKECAKQHATEMADAAFPRQLKGPWRKLVAYAGRLALILDIAHRAEQKRRCTVEAESVSRAWSLIHYFKGHARRAYGHLAHEPITDKMAAIMEFAEANYGSATVREILTARVAGCKNRAEVLAIFERVARMRAGTIEVDTRSSGGLPTVRLQLHSQREKG